MSTNANKQDSVSPDCKQTIDVEATSVGAQADRVLKPNYWYLFWKRAFDIVSSGLLILLISWLLLIVAIGVKISSKGPILFKDARVGKNGKDIRVWKFRSMYIDAEERMQEKLTPEQYEQWLKERKIDDDPRITKFGHFIRKTSLDELPQLFNIFGGTISVVGPRPISRMELDGNFTKEQQKVLLSAKPGLISNWAVNGRSDVTFDNGERQRLELEYIGKNSLFLDLWLILKAIPAVLRHKGAK